MEIHPLLAALIRGMSRAHTQLYRLLGGRGLLNRNTLILTTTGRKSGRETAIPLLYVREGDCLYIVASFGGNDRAPHWYLNLRAHPEVQAEVEGASARYQARTLAEDEAAPIWPRLLAMYPAYASYQKRTERRIPVVELAPRV